MSLLVQRPLRNRAFRTTLGRPGGSFPSYGRSMRRLMTSARQRLARGRTQTMMRQRRNIRSGQGVTTQHDQRTVYRRKTMPRSKKRSWVSFNRKVKAVADKELGSRTVIFNKLTTFSNATSGNQISGFVTLYGHGSSAADPGNQDLYLISGYENTGDPTAAAGTTVDGSTKFMFQSGVLDVTFRNNSTYYNGTVFSNQGDAKLEVDVYEIIIQRELGDFNAANASLYALFAENASVTKPIAPVAGAVEIVDTLRGVTPWDMTYSLSRYGIKILKKTKYVVPNADTFTYQVRDPSRHTCTYKELNQTIGFSRKGWTRILYFTGKLVAGLPLGVTAGNYQEVLNVGHTRKYLYKVEGQNEDRSRYVGQ